MQKEIIQTFTDYYTDLDMFDRQALAELYSDDIEFSDPIHSLNGLDALHQYFKGMANNVECCTFNFHRQIIKDNQAYLEWDMKLTMKGSTNVIEVPGVTYVEYGEKIHLHRDYFDAGKMFYENVPILEKIIKYIKRRIAS
jgi:limonene-1,2-epoxide hydrolase